MTLRTIRATVTQQNERETRSDARIQFLQTRTPAQIETYVDNNSANLAEVRVLLKIILKLLVMLFKKSG